MSVQYILCSI